MIEGRTFYPGHKFSRAERAELYNRAFPDRPPLVYHKGWAYGVWRIGNNFRTTAKGFYGAYPPSYLERVHSMFPDADHVLHAFSGSLTAQRAAELAWPNSTPEQLMAGLDPMIGSMAMELVDLHGPDSDPPRFPTWRGDLLEMPEEWASRFDLVIADPPYSADDAEIYGVRMPARRKIMESLARVTRTGGNLVWLDQVWPQHRAAQWKTWADVAVIRSTNHRIRSATILERQ